MQDRDAKTAVRRFPAPVVDLRFLELNPNSLAAASAQSGLLQLADILACPRCSGDLEFFLDLLECKCCGSRFASDSGIPQLFFPHDVLYGPADVTQKVKDFYDAHPFPKYDDTDSNDSLREQMSSLPIARLLDQHLSSNALILDAGCGTGPVSYTHLTLPTNREV